MADALKIRFVEKVALIAAMHCNVLIRPDDVIYIRD